MVDLRAPVRSVLSSRGMEVTDDQLHDMIRDLHRLAALLVAISEEAGGQVPDVQDPLSDDYATCGEEDCQ